MKTFSSFSSPQYLSKWIEIDENFIRAYLRDAKNSNYQTMLMFVRTSS